MSIMKFIPDTRPYWHVDAKWIFGILLTISLSCLLILSTAHTLSSKENAPRIVATIIGKSLMHNNTVDTTEITKKIKQSGGKIHPIPFIPSITITAADLKLTQDELSLKIFLPITNNIYDNGIEEAANEYIKSETQKEQFIKQAFFLQYSTKTTHDTLMTPIIILGALSILFSCAVIYFSAGWGRLSNIGLLLIYVSLPGIVVANILLHTGQDSASQLPNLASEIIASTLNKSFSATAWIGVLLLVAALVGKVSQIIVHRNHKAKQNK